MGEAIAGGEDSPPGGGRRGGNFLGIEENEFLEGEGRIREFEDMDIVGALRWLTSEAASMWGENGSLEEPLVPGCNRRSSVESLSRSTAFPSSSSHIK